MEATLPHMRDRIVDAAARLFAERGFDGTSIQAVADAVGIRKPSLLYHFSSKEELRRVVLEQMLVRWKDDLPRVLAAAQSGKDRLHTLMTALLDFFVEQPYRARLLIREMVDHPDAMRELFHEHLSPWTTLLTDAIRMGQESGRVYEDVDAESYIIQVVSMAVGVVATGDVTAAMLGDKRANPVQSQIQELVRIARRSLFKPRPPE